MEPLSSVFFVINYKNSLVYFNIYALFLLKADLNKLINFEQPDERNG